MKTESWGIFCKIFGVNPRNRVIEFLLEGGDLDFSIGTLAEQTELNRATAYNIMEELIREGIVIPTRRMSGAQLYKLNSSKEEAKLLMRVFELLLDKVVEKHIKRKAKLELA